MSSFHTMGGCCIYCGIRPTSTEQHLQKCQKYREAKAIRESLPPPDDKEGEIKPREGAKRPFCAESPPLPTCHNNTNLTKAAARQRVTPPTSVNEHHGHWKKPKPMLDESTFHCLACGKEGCPHENGFTVMKEGDGQAQEFDPCEPILLPGHAIPFDKIKFLLKPVVVGMMRSAGFWPRHKFIGSAKLDLKLKTWMKSRLNATVVDKNWGPLRRAVKETLRYKRQHSVDLIQTVHNGESTARLSLLVSWNLLANPMDSCHSSNAKTRIAHDNSPSLPAASIWQKGQECSRPFQEKYHGCLGLGDSSFCPPSHGPSPPVVGIDEGSSTHSNLDDLQQPSICSSCVGAPHDEVAALGAIPA